MKKIDFLLRYQSLLVLFLGGVCVLITSYAVLRGDFFRPHDFTHAARIAEMYTSLQAGEFPVRWSTNFGFGYGMPLFNFYAPLPYYVAQIPYIFTRNAILSIKFLYIVNGVLAFSGMYLFARELWGRRGATISAVSFTFATYRAVDLYVRGALGEASAMVLIPFALYGVARLSSNRKQGVVLLSLSLAAVLLSHNLIGMITIGFVCLYGLFTVGIRRFPWVLASVFLSFCLSAFYILPAFFEKEFTRVESAITTGYFDFHNHFMGLRQFLFGQWGYGGSQPGLEDGISFALGYIPLFLCVMSGVAVIVFRKKHAQRTLLALFFLLGLSMLMATAKSQFIWERVEVLKYMQFPWRFLTFVHVFLSAIVGAVAIGIQKIQSETTRTVVIGILIASFIIVQGRFFTPEKFISDTNEYYNTDPFFIRSEMSKTLNDYLPRELSADTLPDPVIDRMILTNGDGWILVENDEPTFLKSQVTCTTECEVQVNIFDFPGWQVSVNGKQIEATEPSDPLVALVSIPSGVHDITVQLKDTNIRRIGNGVSVIGVLFTAGLLIYQYGKRKDNIISRS